MKGTDENKTKHNSFYEKMEKINYYIIALAISVLIFGIVPVVILNDSDLVDQNNKGDQYIELVAWTLWTCILFLPAVHERYSYPAEVIMIISAILNIKRTSLFIVRHLCSFFLFDYEIEQQYLLSVF